MNKKNYLSKINLLNKVITIFEKEIIILVYYLLFNFSALGGDILNLQFLFLILGTGFQIYLKTKDRLIYWNNFIIVASFLLGSLFNLNHNIFFTGFLVFLLAVSIVSFAYEKWGSSIKNKIILNVISILYSAIVFLSFPALYYSFMKNKISINLLDFFQSEDHMLVFSGYMTIYVLILINKQLLLVQTNLFKKHLDE